MNNKGFAITTILYGTFLLFMMLLLVMLGILSRYKDNLSILMDKTNGARDIIDIYGRDSYLMTIEGPNGEARKYYKAYAGSAIIGYVYNGQYTGPLLISINPCAVVYFTSHKPHLIWGYEGKVEHMGAYYYYSTTEFWMSGDRTATSPYNWPKYKQETGESLKDVVKKILNEKVKYRVNSNYTNNYNCAKIEGSTSTYY